VSFAIQTIVGLGYMRNACSVFRNAGTATDPLWQAQPIGDPSSAFEFKDSDDGVGVFSTALAVNPDGFSPYGDLVSVKSKMLEFASGFPADFVPLSPPPSRLGTIWGWITFPAFSETTVYALIFIPDKNGADHAVFALPDEIDIHTPNPHFA